MLLLLLDPESSKKPEIRQCASPQGVHSTKGSPLYMSSRAPKGRGDLDFEIASLTTFTRNDVEKELPKVGCTPRCFRACHECNKSVTY